VQRYHYDNHSELKRHLSDFVDAYNFGRRLKTIKALTPLCVRPGTLRVI
jgi:hypothetical protein